MALQQCFDGGQAYGHPMFVPGSLLFSGDGQYVLQVIEHPHVVDRMDIAADQVGDFQHAGTLQSIGRDQPWAGVLAVEVVDDGQGLGQQSAIDIEHRHTANRTALAMFATVLLTDPQVDALVVVGQLLQRERNTHPVRSGAIEETVELHSDCTYGRSMNDD
ncbi:hypothetical protein D3C75_716380 [compost metagenome]